MTVQFRAYSAPDFPAVNALAAQVHALHAAARPDIFAPSDAPYTVQDSREWQRDPGVSVFVAEGEGQILAYAVLQYSKSRSLPILRRRTVCCLEDFCVDQSVRRSGIGRRFFTFLETQAVKRGADTLELTVWAFNQAALDFYKAVGMTPRAFRMEKKL